MSFPEAIPEEIFVYFGKKINSNTLNNRERLLNQHFFHHYYTVKEQRQQKDVYLSHGFTQRNQKVDKTEEKLKEEILSDFNEIDMIQIQES